MSGPPTVLFLCPHNAAKSVIAQAYFELVAEQRGLDVRATSGGTEPDPVVSPGVVEALRAEGIDVSAHRPRQVTREELVGAWRVVSLGCDLGDLAPPGLIIERWDDVPPPSQGIDIARDAIRRRVDWLVDELDSGGGRRAT